jgi:hypothetical protein
MNRTVLAFIAAPLIVPIILVPYFAAKAPNIGVLFPLIMSTFVSYIGVFMFGLPAYLLLRTNHLTSFLISIPLGFAIGGVMLFISNAILALLLDQGISGIREALANTGTLSYVLWPFGPLGALVGIVLWLIARPDRS